MTQTDPSEALIKFVSKFRRAVPPKDNETRHNGGTSEVNPRKVVESRSGTSRRLERQTSRT